MPGGSFSLRPLDKYRHLGYNPKVDSPRYVARLHLQVTIPFTKDWATSHTLVRIRALDYLQVCIERTLSVQRDPVRRTFPEWKVQFAEPGPLPGSGCWR